MKSYQRPCRDCGGPRHKDADNGRCVSCYWEWRRALSPYTGLTQTEYDAQRYNPTARRDTFLQQKHGISLAEYDAMWLEQDGCCAICGQHENQAMTTHAKLVVDHDHETGLIRALLCDLCNKGLGQFRDDITRLRSALGYLEEHHGRIHHRLALVVGDVSGD